MESLLWMLDLVVVVYLCFWALREDRKENGKGVTHGRPPRKE
jgi:hypothetical protein